MITIKESKPYDLAAGCSEGYGKDFMARISPKTARELCGMYPMPRIGYEVTVAVGGVVTRVRLDVANVSGHYYVRSFSTAIENWPHIFGVTLERYKEAT